MASALKLQNRHVRSVFSILTACLLIASIAYLGVHTYKASHAASGASIYLTPNSAAIRVGDTLSVTVRENSNTDTVNSVQTSLSYDPSKLQYMSLSEGGAFPLVAATSTGTAGLIRVGRASSGTVVSGDNAVVTVNFKVIGTAATDTISMDRSYSSLVSSVDNKDILQVVGSGSYTASARSTSGAVAASSLKPVLTMSPSSGSFAPGAVLHVALHLNAYSASATTVEAIVGYPASQLQYIDTTDGAIFAVKQRTKATPGNVDIIRSVPGGSEGVNGDNLLVTLNFKVIGTKGDAGITVGAASAVFDATGSGQSILNLSGSSGAAYAISAGGSATTPVPVAEPPVVTSSADDGSTGFSSPGRALVIASGAGQASITTTEDGSAVVELSGIVGLRPLIDQTEAASDTPKAISKVEYFIDKKLISTQKTAPYAFKFDSSSRTNGTYAVVVKTSYTDGTVGVKTEKLIINNKTTPAYFVKHYGISAAAVTAILIVVGVVIWRLALPRFARARAAALPVIDYDTKYSQDTMYGFGSQPGTSSNAPVASDPMVVSPFQPTTDAVMTEPTPGNYQQSVSMAQTTPALPIETFQQLAPELVPTELPIISSAASTITPTPTASPTPLPQLTSLETATEEQTSVSLRPTSQPQILQPPMVYRPDVTPVNQLIQPTATINTSQPVRLDTFSRPVVTPSQPTQPLQPRPSQYLPTDQISPVNREQ